MHLFRDYIRNNSRDCSMPMCMPVIHPKYSLVKVSLTYASRLRFTTSSEIFPEKFHESFPGVMGFFMSFFTAFSRKYERIFPYIPVRTFPISPCFSLEVPQRLL